jgi:hypothetical protein
MLNNTVRQWRALEYRTGFRQNPFMSKTWNHPQLGTFQFDKEREAWVGACSMPAFKLFKWDVESTKPGGRCELLFRTPEGREPSEDAARLVLRLVANDAKLAPLVTTTLWDEFNGRGHKSEMWWYGDMDQVAENFGYDDRPSPTGPSDLVPVMGFMGLAIRESLHEYNMPIAELTFSAVFEEEHGVGVLTDGDTILGTGYASDVLTYEMQARSASSEAQSDAEPDLEPPPSAPLAETVQARKKEMQQIMAHLRGILAGPTEEKRRWDKLFPAPSPEARVDTDVSMIFGDWKLDHAETAKVLTQLGEKKSAAQAKKDWPNPLLRISRKALNCSEGDILYDERTLRKCQRRGTRFTFFLLDGSALDFWCDGELLVDDAGRAWRRAR